ncbi:LOG family protein [Methylovirgula sp. 4M-Z18]|uniref:LOG family protein n=1 Tax=Methylovirgula sp. 4M-Z18 TaxID=2293567 RepID=UPI000E2F0D78|nr:TIGR00730 family Rossman fold protein [Methylovirgula sp. 4M-Z18]RFB79394.1 TIGR00730 family Rossman fold protein [Methylovirgula sp. 4M-Z18]
MTDTKPLPTAQMASATYRVPALDQDFILGDAQRGLRFQMEYEKAEQTLRNWGVRSTVVVFGSARVREDGPPKDQRRYAEARRLARIISEQDGALSPKSGIRDNVIATGGGPGIMEAANRGAHDAGAPTIGFNITLPHEQQPNAYTTPELTFQFHYFSMRKMHLAMRANALVVFPGGFGTFDESFEILTLVQTGKMPPVPIIFFEEAYWRKIINFDALVEEGVIAAKDLDLIDFVDTAEDAWAIIQKKQRAKS